MLPDERWRLYRAVPPPEALRWVEESVGARARIAEIRPLPGGLSAAVHAVDVVDAGGTRHALVLKRFLRSYPDKPDMAFLEGRALRLVERLDVPTPLVVAVDRHGERADAPSLLMTRLPGEPVTRPADEGPWVRDLAALLPAIHALDVAGRGLPRYQPYAVERRAVPPAWTRRPDVWERAIDVFKGPAPEPPSCFIHRDFHPGNVLWHEGRVSGVVDWYHACVGAPAADIGHCRVNLWELCGREAADRLVEEYRALAPSAPDYHPYWDLAAALGDLYDLDPLRAPTGRPTPKEARARARLDTLVLDAVSRL